MRVKIIGETFTISDSIMQQHNKNKYTKRQKINRTISREHLLECGHTKGMTAGNAKRKTIDCIWCQEDF